MKILNSGYKKVIRSRAPKTTVFPNTLLKYRFRDPTAMQWSYQLVPSGGTLPGKCPRVGRLDPTFDRQPASGGTLQNGFSTAC